MSVLALILAAVSVLPADRLAMADRLFNRGRYGDAKAEYRALQGEQGVAADEIAFRLAECERAAGQNEAARKAYAEIISKYPDSKHAPRCRFLYAMGAESGERRRLLTELDSDLVDPEIRVAALYHLGSETSNPELLSKCVKLDPCGKYADYANLKYGMLLNGSKDAGERRKGVEVLLGIAFGKSPLAEDALYLAGVQSYREKHYGEAGSLFRRYLRNYPKGVNAADARTMSAWCDFLEGHYSDAVITCGEGETDDLAYIRAACAYSIGDHEKALRLFRKYLADYPQGNYRVDAELPIARIEFDAAQKENNASKTIESAKRGFGLSKLAADQLRLAWAYEKAGKTDEAKDEYTRIAKSFPGTIEGGEALYRKAMIEARAGNWSLVEMTLAEALATGKMGEREAEALYWRGIAAVRIEHEAEGMQLLEKALAKGLGLDEQREARLMLADYDLRSGHAEKAKTAYRELVKNGACERMTAARILSVGRLLGGESAEICAKALTKADAPEWRQAGWVLLGEACEKREAYTEAIDAYRRCVAEKATTEELSSAVLHLGRLESRAGETDRSDASLKKAIALNSDNPAARAEAYVLLARNAGSRGDWKTACSYATVVTSLFSEGESVKEAKRILAAHEDEL